MFVAVTPWEALEVESTTAKGFYYLLQLLRESLFDGATIGAAQALTAAVQGKMNFEDG